MCAKSLGTRSMAAWQCCGISVPRFERGIGRKWLQCEYIPLWTMVVTDLDRSLSHYILPQSFHTFHLTAWHFWGCFDTIFPTWKSEPLFPPYRPSSFSSSLMKLLFCKPMNRKSLTTSVAFPHTFKTNVLMLSGISSRLQRRTSWISEHRVVILGVEA